MHIDVGCGDARGPLCWARAQPDWLFVAVDPNAAGLSEAAWRASRKPQRGGVPNLVCVAATPEELAAEVGAVARRVSVILPWGTLLRGVASPEPGMLRALRGLCLPGARLDVVFSCVARDARRAAMPPIEAEHVERVLPPAYRRADLLLTRVALIEPSALARLGTTWAKRLAHGRPRAVWQLSAAAHDGGASPRLAGRLVDG